MSLVHHSKTVVIAIRKLPVVLWLNHKTTRLDRIGSSTKFVSFLEQMGAYLYDTVSYIVGQWNLLGVLYDLILQAVVVYI